MPSNACPPLPRRDLDEVLEATAALWQEVRGQRIFVTGGTGFFGCWLVESFLHVNRELGLQAKMTVLTRDPAAFLRRLPHLRDAAAFQLVQGDVRGFGFPAGQFRYVVHAATEASARQLAQAPGEMLSTMLEGTQRVLEFAAQAATVKLLFTSSGAVYGPQPPGLSRVTEEFPGAPNPLLTGSVYGEGKRASEMWCALAARHGLAIKIARCYTFVGPHLPLDAHFAAGNFLRDALAGRSIEIASDGRSVRSYLYAADLAAWLWTILLRGESLQAYNVGSEEAVTIRELAEAVARGCEPQPRVQCLPPQESGSASRYVPSTERVRKNLSVTQRVSLDEGLRRTMAWLRLN